MCGWLTRRSFARVVGNSGVRCGPQQRSPTGPMIEPPFSRRILRCMCFRGTHLTLLVAVVLFRTALASAGQSQIQPPLHTNGHDSLDAADHRVRLTSVNWYGFDQKEYVVGGLDHAPLAT